jgi:hypothetical protein
MRPPGRALWLGLAVRIHVLKMRASSEQRSPRRDTDRVLRAFAGLAYDAEQSNQGVSQFGRERGAPDAGSRTPLWSQSQEGVSYLVSGGEPPGIRTLNPRIKSPSLYR